jgi:hypothetical protein
VLAGCAPPSHPPGGICHPTARRCPDHGCWSRWLSSCFCLPLHHLQPPSTVETSDPSGVQRSSLSGVYRVDYQVG